MPEPGSGSTTQKIVAEVFIAGSPEAVWHEITKQGVPQGAFFDAVLHTTGLEPGAPVQMRDKSGKYTIVVGRVIDFDPPRRFAHTFKFTRYDDAECLVIYELEPTEGGTQFRLIVEGATPGSRTSKDMTGGAKLIVNTMKSIIERGNKPLMLRVGFAVMGLLAPLMTPKTCRTENWPLV